MKNIAMPILPIAVRQRSIRIALTLTLLALFFFSCLSPASEVAAASTLIVESNVAITPPPGAHLNWYDMKADPENAQNLIVCGAIRDAEENAYVGILYYSHDGGKSWKIALEDRNSSWVSEQSCAFGSHHHAYFISEASKVIDGVPNHKLGTTHIFRSSDAGATWTEAGQTSWADYSNSVVRTSSAGTDELYVFFNGTSSYDVGKRLGNTLGYFVTSADGTHIERHETTPGMAGMNYQGVFPSSSVVLNDGSIVALYNAGIASEKKGTIPVEIGVVRFTQSGPSPPVVIADPTFRYKPPLCPSSLSTSLAYDRNKDLLYVAFNSVRREQCAIVISTSNDGGRTWSVPREVQGGKRQHRSMYFPIAAVNDGGMLGLLWRGRADLSPGCWYFSTSHDIYKLDESVELSRCSRGKPLKQQSSQYLATLIAKGQTGQPDTVQVLSLRDYLTRVVFPATEGNVFHPVWLTSTNGMSELRTARVLTSPCISTSKSENTSKITKMTSEIAIVYAGSQTIDNHAGLVDVDLAFENQGARVLNGPLYLRLENASSDFGKLEMVSGPGCRIPGTDYFELRLPGATLSPGQRTDAYRFSFHFASVYRRPPEQYLVAKLVIRVLARGEPLIKNGIR